VDTQAMKARLEQLLADLDRAARTLQGEHAGENGELTSLDQHQADSASDMSDADRQKAALEVVQAQHSQVQAALNRIADGSYGNCVDCGATLPDERLEARPEAMRCVNCQQRVEGRR
jgi:DnaK suppressor protein